MQVLIFIFDFSPSPTGYHLTRRSVSAVVGIFLVLLCSWGLVWSEKGGGGAGELVKPSLCTEAFEEFQSKKYGDKKMFWRLDLEDDIHSHLFKLKQLKAPHKLVEPVNRFPRNRRGRGNERKLQLESSSRAKHGGAYFSAVPGRKYNCFVTISTPGLLLEGFPRPLSLLYWILLICQVPGGWQGIFVQTFSTRFCQDFDMEVHARFRSWSLILIEILKLGLVKILKFKF